MPTGSFKQSLPRLCMAAALAALAGWGVLEITTPATTEGTSQHPGRSLGAIPLLNENGLPASLDAFKGHWVVLFFGYASCPDVCPTSLAYLAQEFHQLGPGSGDVTGIFVSLDPKRDKPDAIGRYVHYFDPKLVALTGSEDNLRALTKQLGVYYEIQPAAKGSPEAAYTLAHTASFFILGPDGQLADTLSPPFEKGAVVSALRQLTAAQTH